MKKKLVLLALLGVSSPLFASGDNDSTGMAGDQLDLYGVLDLFRQSKDLESFEKALNTESNQVNNLDLNGDNETDYIRVIDKSDSSSHAIILQVPVSDQESQDVAVIELEKTGNENAQIQIVGDEDLYGKYYIIEPGESTDTKMAVADRRAIVVVNVWSWPTVRFIYGPMYRPWVSPWYWRHYPPYWKPWKPVPFAIYHPRVIHYHILFRPAPVYRCVVAHRVYHPYRTRSVIVAKRHPVRATAGPRKMNPGPARGAQPKNGRSPQPKKAGPRRGGHR